MPTLTASRAAAFAALRDPVPRALYRLAAHGTIGRDEAAEALGIPRSTAAFHLDRLAEAGLLAVEYQRRSGRSGPGAGRPAKLYRAAATELAASIPERHYELAADLLASALEHADREGVAVREAVDEEAFAAGAAIGAGHDTLDSALSACGYDPHTDARGAIVLENCPFHLLASRHTPLVCGANVHLVRGLAAATGDERTPVLAPHDGRCCVEVQPAPPASATA